VLRINYLSAPIATEDRFSGPSSAKPNRRQRSICSQRRWFCTTRY